ncbi:CLUMA_CG007248, isoform A [Clunio marinus]|uniref:CLUMA_CG007248, isoform A n=1 Tax=Clunio marinus TaxID=568069 RepID=A0A1J1I048_9DIPT|nr:CLUMA_CG007248, isoform A [Clunio marinus]
MKTRNDDRWQQADVSLKTNCNFIVQAIIALKKKTLKIVNNDTLIPVIAFFAYFRQKKTNKQKMNYFRFGSTNAK